jgi:hypothetical protein
MTADKSNPHHSPDDEKGDCRDRQLENTARTIGLAITGKQLHQRANFRLAFNHV